MTIRIRDPVNILAFKIHRANTYMFLHKDDETISPFEAVLY